MAKANYLASAARNFIDPLPGGTGSRYVRLAAAVMAGAATLLERIHAFTSALCEE
jgi:hypothetical protein